jgi:drug/metabolite transporter (DMT)-like permease
MVTAAALLFAVNGAFSKVILTNGVSSARLAQVRSTGALLVLAVRSCSSVRGCCASAGGSSRFLAVFGVAGNRRRPAVLLPRHHRIAIGIALLLQYIAPLLVALWARYVMHEPVRRRIWVALACALFGLSLMVEVWNGLALDAAGVMYAARGRAWHSRRTSCSPNVPSRGATRSASRATGSCSPRCSGLSCSPGGASPNDVPGRDTSLLGHLDSIHLPVWALMTWMVVLGTIVPFGLVVAALRDISATRAGIVAMLEPVAGTIIAYAWLGETLTAVQVAGGLVVLAGILLAQTAR